MPKLIASLLFLLILCLDSNPEKSCTPDKLLAAETLARPGTEALPALPKRPDVLLLIPGNSRCAIVEKESQTLFLYRNTPSGIEIERTFACSTGVQGGEKLEQGDEKTPEGIYILGKTLPPTQLPQIYGKMAITLDYPNAFDRLQGKSGDGIWLHGTNEPVRANKTHGCVVISNEDIEQLSNLVALNQTPLVIVPKIRFRTEDENNLELEILKSFLADWRTCWENKQLERYISMYSTRFQSDSQQTLRDWESYKQAVFSRAGKIQLGLQLVSAVRSEKYIILTLRQDYRSDRLISKGTKRLFVVREKSGWKIIAEEWSRS